MSELDYWTKLREAERELEAATPARSDVNAAARKLQRAKAELKRLGDLQEDCVTKSFRSISLPHLVPEGSPSEPRRAPLIGYVGESADEMSLRSAARPISMALPFASARRWRRRARRARSRDRPSGSPPRRAGARNRACRRLSRDRPQRVVQDQLGDDGVDIERAEAGPACSSQIVQRPVPHARLGCEVEHRVQPCAPAGDRRAATAREHEDRSRPSERLFPGSVRTAAGGSGTRFSHPYLVTAAGMIPLARVQVQVGLGHQRGFGATSPNRSSSWR